MGYTKLVTEQGTYKTSLSYSKVLGRIRESDGWVRLPPYGNCDKATVNKEKITQIVKKRG